MIETAIVILNWNGLEHLKKFLGTVIKYSSIPETMVYVADNGSTDGSVEWISDNYSTIKLIKLDKNYGFAEGYNIAIGQISAKYIILLNSDVEVTEGWLSPLINFMNKNTDVAACQPKILSYQNKEYFEYAGAAGGFIDKFGYPFCRGRIFSTLEKDYGQYDSHIDIFWASGACMVVRMDAWNKCGGFDNSFFAHMEEIDLCWRFINSGYRISYIPESVVYHVGGGALAYNSPFKTYLNFRNNLFMLYKNLPDKKFHRTLFIRKIMDFLAAIMFISEGDFRNIRSVWKAHMDYYRQIKSLRTKRSMLNTSPKDGSSLILNRSIVLEYYIKRNKTFESLKM